MTNKVLTISSYVCSGFVGNRCGMIILDSFQIQSIFVLTTHLANHTGYPVVGGSGVLLNDFISIMDSLEVNHLDKDIEFLVTGYFPSSDLVYETINRVKRIKDNKKVYFLCDPILGDNGKMYTKSEVQDSMKELIKYADIITPNATELSFLTGLEVNSVSEAIKACHILHEQGIPVILVTSIKEGNDIILLCSFKDTLNNKNFTIKIPRIEGDFTGVGDTLTYILLSWIIKGIPLEHAVNRAISTLQTILRNTVGTAEINIINCIPYLKGTEESFTITYI
ncbi:pyridoxal kinase, putative [Entamoeba histolytica HM-1:IMSS-B]|uniref:pyridoxal kinase n=6 Tax=Entamoeba histolytica TaxID=5759 RepID=C4LVZ4_ENTH1|nr:pyridoxal kinase, putative [Entamoeba histolytica HM-1:IMSS]EMD46698.1 pyridoxal kinase, putative [Entamoeba histolytica KU27]EMH75584.1 pyridoxal kinase, putative [Entamoeba histolytica HM-1:IMSS-B]EMS17964.1 pyridoxal kinase [Entamoeba histolytica HM-3:IMSS]ENY59809.1 pyridoxal kinase, putative [Entamoeba histolytica HM-1:IMSS-A]GAT92855.1 pyridoxal kinase putative [Entamoeba histolytica]|eukprot:XP_652481.1 pyridoxal kinase, putative [Entamoeba histolytica HM-1:IMSS]